MIRFADPWFLSFLLLLLPVFLLQRKSGGRFHFSSLAILKKIKKDQGFNPFTLLHILRILSLLFLIMAFARPQSGKTFTEVKSEGVDILLLLDTSGSMKAMDFKLNDERVTRLDVVKGVVKKFIKKRAGDRIGLIVFGDDAYTQCPLTLDHGILISFLDKIEIGMAGEGTAIGSAIGIGVNRIKDIKSKSKIMVLLTDGENTAGDISPEKAADLASDFAVKTYTIGVGTRGQAPFLVNTLFGQRLISQPVQLDEELLRSIASKTGAYYYRATDTTELEKIYDQIDQLEKTEIKSKEYTEYKELFHLFLILALCLILAEVILGNTILRKLP